MKEIKSWNPVLNKFIEIKNEYMKQYETMSYDMVNGITCFERWVIELNNKEYIDLVSPLQLTQFNDLLLIRYGRYSDVFGGEEDITYEDFWDMYDGFYMECRSVVINVRTNELVLTPFRKFRNLNECEENSLENITKRIKNAKCVEFSNKLDGSMQSATYYNGEYTMAGSMALDVENSWRLADGYRMLDDRYKKLLYDCDWYTFIFEYISMKDAHVVNYTKEQEGLYLIGARDIRDGSELSYSDIVEIAKDYDIPTTEVYNKTLDEVMKDLSVYKSSEKEGFVVNIDGYKVKIKCDDYVNIHRVLSAISSINLIIKNIAGDTFDDMLSKIPQSYRDRVLKVADVIFKYIRDTDNLVRNYVADAPKTTVKDFMIYIAENVPKNLQSYCREIYLGHDVNYIKSHSNTRCPSYKKLKDMGVENYTELFREED
jgi:hypothetical protein